MESVQQPNILVSLSPAEFAFVHGFITGAVFLNSQQSVFFQEQDKEHIAFVIALKNKLDYFLPNSGDACRHSAQSPDVVGQGGNQCSTCGGRRFLPETLFLFDPDQPDLVDCPDCGGSGLSSSQIERGGNHDCRNTSDCLCLKCVEALSSLGGAHE